MGWQVTFLRKISQNFDGKVKRKRKKLKKKRERSQNFKSQNYKRWKIVRWKVRILELSQIEKSWYLVSQNKTN